MKYLKTLTAVISICFLACSNTNTSTNSSTDKLSKSNFISVSDISCLEKYLENPCEILSSQEVIKEIGLDPTKVQIKDPQMIKVARRLDCVYLWNSGRKEKIKTAVGEMDSDLNDKVDIGQFRKYDAKKENMSVSEWFDSSFPMMSKKELETREARYKEQEAKGESNPIEKMTIRTFKNLNRQRFEGLGDRAISDIHKNLTGGTVMVLHKNIAFQVSVDVSKDKEANLDFAKKIARIVLEKCDN